MLHIEQLTKRYGSKTAVDHLSLHIPAGEVYGFIGHNGAGKTTTLRTIAGLLPIEEGEITVCGKSVRTDALEAKRHMAYIPDDPELYPFLTGVQFLKFIADIRGMSASQRTERISLYADRLSLTQELGQPISSYSHGMKQKLAIISAWMHAPSLILMDEPFVGLDPIASHTLKEMMREHCRGGGAIFFSTHVLEVAEKLCDSIAIIKNGKLVMAGPTEQVRGDTSLEEVFLELEENHD